MKAPASTTSGRRNAACPWRQRHQRRPRKRPAGKARQAVARVVERIGVGHARHENRSARGVHAPHVRKRPGSASSSDRPERALHQRRHPPAMATRTRPGPAQSSTPPSGRRATPACQSPLPGIRLTALNGHRRVRAAVEIQRVAGQPPVVNEPEERTQPGDGTEQNGHAPAPSSPWQKKYAATNGQQEPAFVARQGARAGRHRAPATAPQPCVSRNRTVKYSSAMRHAHERRLRHGDGLQVEHVGIEREQAPPRPAPPHPNAKIAPHRREQERAGHHEAQAPTESPPPVRCATARRGRTSGSISTCGSGSHTVPIWS